MIHEICTLHLINRIGINLTISQDLKASLYICEMISLKTSRSIERRLEGVLI